MAAPSPTTSSPNAEHGALHKGRAGPANADAAAAPAAVAALVVSPARARRRRRPGGRRGAVPVPAWQQPVPPGALRGGAVGVLPVRSPGPQPQRRVQHRPLPGEAAAVRRGVPGLVSAGRRRPGRGRAGAAARVDRSPAPATGAVADRQRTAGRGDLPGPPGSGVAGTDAEVDRRARGQGHAGAGPRRAPAGRSAGRAPAGQGAGDRHQAGARLRPGAGDRHPRDLGGQARQQRR